MYRVFIDGQEGTTGLEIFQRFENRMDIEIVAIDPSKRKDPSEKKKIMNSVDIVFLCLPDTAACESVALIDNPDVKIIDASTAHRTNPSWDYGFPELSQKHRENIKNSKRVANPGCYASGFISLCYPLVEHKIITKNHPITCYGISGFSGGGKGMIAEYNGNPEKYKSPRFYGLGQKHKHLPEMKEVCGLDIYPMFNPIVDDYYNGMVVNVPLHSSTLTQPISPKELQKVFAQHYGEQNFVKVMPFVENQTEFLDVNSLANSNNMEIYINGSSEHILLTARFDNLGKGASGSAVQCMNIMLGIDETTGLL